MMKLNRLMGAGLLALAPTVTMAQGIGNSVDVYYISSGVEIKDPAIGTVDADGDGFGIKGAFAIADRWFLSGEYQTADNDFKVAGFNGEIALDQLRLGIGFNASLSEQTRFIALVEYIRQDGEVKIMGLGDGSKENGYGLHVGIQFDIGNSFGIEGRVGYVDVEADGVEFLVGANYRFSERVGAFLDYRVTGLSDSGTDLDIDDLRAGVRFSF